jgi:nucleotide-binding universal stress UspA family protein
MFKHILVPLDGSPLAESVLPTAAVLAEKLNSEMTLLHVIERAAPAAIHGARHLTASADAEAYLADTAHRLPPGVPVARHVHDVKEPDVAGSIVQHVNEMGVDLVVLCTHGRGKLRHKLFGGIAQRVAGRTRVPILLVPPGTSRAAPAFECHTMLVPLDGDPAHEQGVAPAAGLARSCQASLHLVAVVPTLRTLKGEQAATGQILPGTTAALLELDENHALEYVTEQVAKLTATDLSVTAEVRRGDPASTILDTSERTRADLIVLGTHGRSGLDAFWSASVAPRIAQKARVPLLLVPVRGG